MADANDIEYVDLNGVVSFNVLVGGEDALCQQYIVSINTTAEFNKISTLEIVFEGEDADDGPFALATDAYGIGSDIEVLVGYGEASETVFKGTIIKKAITAKGAGLTITAKHVAEKMTTEKKARTFEDQTVKDIIQSVCGEYGIDVDVEKPGNQSEKKIQGNYSDWDFINIIAEAEGMEVFTTPDGIVVRSIAENDLTQREQALDVVRDYNVNDIKLEIDGRHAHRVYKGNAFDYTSQENAEGESSNANISQSEENEDGDDVNVVAMGTLENSQEMDAKQNMMSVRNDLAFLTGELNISGYAPLQPGDIVRLCDVGQGFDGKVLISSVLHNISFDNWETHLKVGFDDTCYVDRFSDIAPKPAMGTLPAMNGLLLAKVESLAGDPMGEGRIYVRLLNSVDMKLWCRVSTLDAGNERGSFFLPEIDDEVIVGFIDGDPNNAVVLGMLHSSSSPAPMEITDENHVKGFFSREKIQLLFDDEKKALSIETPGGNKLLISDDEKGVSLEDQNGNTIVMNDQGITIESKKALTLKAAQDVSIEGNNVNIKANAQLVAQGSASAEFSASGNTVIKGGLVQIN